MRKQSNTLNFEGQNIYVGIDVHLKSWTVSIQPIPNYRSIAGTGWFSKSVKARSCTC